jgi:hypothetical protein
MFFPPPEAQVPGVREREWEKGREGRWGRGREGKREARERNSEGLRLGGRDSEGGREGRNGGRIGKARQRGGEERHSETASQLPARRASLSAWATVTWRVRESERETRSLTDWENAWEWMSESKAEGGREREKKKDR